VGAAITVIKPFYAKFRHIRKSTFVVSVAALFNVRIDGRFTQSSQNYAARKTACSCQENIRRMFSQMAMRQISINCPHGQVDT
jgi:hypothetical protein